MEPKIGCPSVSDVWGLLQTITAIRPTALALVDRSGHYVRRDQEFDCLCRRLDQRESTPTDYDVSVGSELSSIVETAFHSARCARGDSTHNLRHSWLMSPTYAVEAIPFGEYCVVLMFCQCPLVSNAGDLEAAEAYSTLTEREREVLHLIGRGNTSKEIAGLLSINPGTVGDHRKAICRKLGLHSTAKLAVNAVRLACEWACARFARFKYK